MKQVPPSPNLPLLESEIRTYWKAGQIFERSLTQRKDGQRYMFYDGPPFPSGAPHYGHLLIGTVKDIVPRYQTMKGRYVERRFGWDTHGLPMEMLIEKELGLKGRTDILNYGVGPFNEACRGAVMRYVEEWRAVTEQLGRWVDFEHDYKTMDLSFMESVWWVFKQLWDSEL
jgi:isoleucyl-tRNA synthetase